MQIAQLNISYISAVAYELNVSVYLFYWFKRIPTFGLSGNRQIIENPSGFVDSHA